MSFTFYHVISSLPCFLEHCVSRCWSQIPGYLEKLVTFPLCFLFLLCPQLHSHVENLLSRTLFGDFRSFQSVCVKFAIHIPLRRTEKRYHKSCCNCVKMIHNKIWNGYEIVRILFFNACIFKKTRAMLLNLEMHSSNSRWGELCAQGEGVWPEPNLFAVWCTNWPYMPVHPPIRTSSYCWKSVA